MSQVQRSTDIVEEQATSFFLYGGPGVFLLLLGGVLWYFNKDGGSLLILSYLLLAMGLGLLGYGTYFLTQMRKVKEFLFDCPYCQAKNALTGEPTADFPCVSCNRMIPTREGKVLPVARVLCGYCRAENFYSDNTIVLLCENCNHEIPISRADGTVAHSPFAVTEDDRTFELTLTGFEHGTEELIACLQQMLALNRNQVKEMLTSLPVVLLTGIPKKKAEMLAAQLAVHHAASDYRPV